MIATWQVMRPITTLSKSRIILGMSVCQQHRHSSNLLFVFFVQLFDIVFIANRTVGAYLVGAYSCTPLRKPNINDVLNVIKYALEPEMIPYDS